MKENTSKKTKKEVILSATYYINIVGEDGNSHKIELDGEETFSTTCPKCQKEVVVAFYEFCAIMGSDDHDLYSTMICCDECSAKSEKQ